MKVNELKIESYLRRPFQVEAVEVTVLNMDAVAEWCEGKICAQNNVDSSGELEQIPYIKVKVFRALNERQTQAFEGDWVLQAGKGFKVYTPLAFEKAFEPLFDDTPNAQEIKDRLAVQDILDPVVHN